MFKSVFKEIIIMLLLLIIIVLGLVILLYDYNPNLKTIPQKLAQYKLPLDVENELSKSVVSEPQDIVKTYKIEEEDLDLYEKTDEYDRGKINPFKFSDTEIATNSNTVAGTNQTTGILNTTGK